MAKEEYINELIQKLETIQSLREEEKQLLRQLPLNIRRYEAGQDIVREGELARQCCLVIGGLVCRYKIVGEGQRQILSLHLPGDIPDIHSLVIPRMDHNLGTLTSATVGFIPHMPVRALTRSSFRIAEAFWRETLIEASIYREWMVGIGKRPAASRIAHFLCEFITKMKAIGLSDGITCNLPMTQTEIADSLGLSTVHMNKQLRKIRETGLVRIRASRITVLNWSGLCELAEFDADYLHLRKQMRD